MTDNRSTMVDQDHLREMIEVISGELELRPLLTIIVQKACELLHADRGSIGLIDSDRDVVIIEAVYKMPPEELGSISRPGDGLAGRVYQDCAPVLLERYGDIGSMPLAEMDEDSVVGMPILWRGDMIGTFGIGAAPPKRFGDNDLRMLSVFARHAAIAINNARSYEREKSFAAMEERQRLARDLHDNVSQLIFSMSLIAQSVSPGFTKNTSEGEKRIKRLLEIAGLAQQEMKALLAELSAPSDDDGSMAAFARRNGLEKALQRHCELTIPDWAHVDMEIDQSVTVPEKWRETLLRIGQEALANAIRHGSADRVIISLATDDDIILFRISDNGRGFDNNGGQPRTTTHLGVNNMRSRAELTGGKFAVKNRSDGGVSVEVRFTAP